ncbi:MAG TPA: hypothetical protein VFI09_04155 [Solirubrobacterales bacterium]|nr:hypothetical protein [Solirubrobacterales bacterium]
MRTDVRTLRTILLVAVASVVLGLFFSPAASATPVGSLPLACRQSTDDFASRTVLVYAWDPRDHGYPSGYVNNWGEQQYPNKEIVELAEEYNWTFRHESSLSSEGSRKLQLVVDCDSSGTPIVHDVEVELSGEEKFEYYRVEDAARVYGFLTGYGNAVKYLVFDNTRDGLAGGHTLGGSDASKSKENYFNTWTFDSMVSWRNGSGGSTPLHELLHAMGAVHGGGKDPAPYSTQNGHCIDGYDVMCYNDGSPNGEEYSLDRCPIKQAEEEERRWIIDCGFDTYFDAKAEPGEWLSTHWNVGEEENPFLMELPELQTTAATEVWGDTAKLNATVASPQKDTEYYFEYYTGSGGYGGASRIPIPAPAEGSGSNQVSATLTHAVPGATYHYRVVASRLSAKTYGNDMTFTIGTRSAPTAATGEATELSYMTAQLNATVDPEGGETTYYFRYGPKGSPLRTSDVATVFGYNPVNVSKTVVGLRPGREYSVEVVAENRSGSQEGEESVFRAPPWVDACETPETPCPKAHRYEAGQPIHASLKAGTTLTLGGESNPFASCSASSLEGQVTDPGGLGKPVGVDISSASFGSCAEGASLSAEELTWHSAVYPAETPGDGTQTIAGLRLKLTVFGITCVYGGSPEFALQGGTQAELSVHGASLSKLSGGLFCPSTLALGATYVLSSPSPLFVESPGGAALCESAEQPCPEGDLYTPGTSFQAELQAGTKTLFSAGLSPECENATLSGAVSGVGASDRPVPVEISTATFGACGSESAEAQGLPWHAKVAWDSAAGNGTMTIPDFKVALTGFGVTCTYEGEVSLELQGGSSPVLTMSEPTSLTKLSGGLYCSKTGFWTASYAIQAPTPLYVAWL